MRLFTFHDHSHKERVFKDAKKTRPKATTRYKRMSNLSKSASNVVKADLVTGIKTFKKKIPSAKLADAWESGDFGALMGVIPWNSIDEDLSPAIGSLKKTALNSASNEILLLPPNINKNLRYDATNPALKNFMNTRTAELVRGISADTQRVIQDAVSQAFTNSWTPREVADYIKDSIGLLPRHALAVRNYARGLVKEGYPAGNILKYSQAYADKLLDYRAMMIARTETQFAINQGQLSVWKEGINQGHIDKETTKKVWVVDGDPCDICQPMDGEAVEINEHWVVEMPDGNLKSVEIPTETHPHCYCMMSLQFSKDKEID